MKNLASPQSIVILEALEKLAVEYYEKKEWTLFGRTVGAMTQHVAMDHKNVNLPKPTTEQKKIATEILQGFLKGADVGTFNFTALLECIYEADQTAEMFYVVATQIIPDIKNQPTLVAKIAESFLAGFFTVSAVKTFETQALPICEQVDSKLANWSKFDDLTS